MDTQRLKQSGEGEKGEGGEPKYSCTFAKGHISLPGNSFRERKKPKTSTIFLVAPPHKNTFCDDNSFRKRTKPHKSTTFLTFHK